MDRDGYSRLPRCMKGFCGKTFREISISKLGGNNAKYCVKGSHASSITAVDFDSVKKKLYGPLCKKTKRMPASVDALFCSGRIFYGIEFKTGDTNATDIVRKIYDTAICMMEHCKKTLIWVRDYFQVVVVAKSLEVENAEKQRRKAVQRYKVNTVIGRSRSFQQYPRIGDGAIPLWGLDKIEGLIANRIFTITPKEFEELCERNDWC